MAASGARSSILLGLRGGPLPALGAWQALGGGCAPTGDKRMGGCRSSVGTVHLVLRVQQVPRELGDALLPLAWGSNPLPTVPGGSCRGSGVSRAARGLYLPQLRSH